METSGLLWERAWDLGQSSGILWGERSDFVEKMPHVGENSGLLAKPCLYIGEESGTLRAKLTCRLGGGQYSVAGNAMCLGDKRDYLRRRGRAFGEKHRIQ